MESGASLPLMILSWHIATCILEVVHPHHQSGSLKVATSLSKYCAYLVAFHPEPLPENQDSAELVFKAMKLELFQLLGLWSYYLPPCSSTRYRKIKSCSEPVETDAAVAATKTVVVRGATLGSKLASKAEQHSKEAVWNVLACLWVELLVYVAPSSDEECVAAHENALAKGGEFITVLWAMATHAGITRPANAPPGTIPIDHTEGIHNA